MKTENKRAIALVITGIGVGGVLGVLGMILKRFGFGDKLKAKVFDLWGQGRGNIMHDPSDDLSKATRSIELKVSPHDSYSSFLSKKMITTFNGTIDESYINSF